MANILFTAFDYPPILSPEAIQLQRRALTLAKNGHRVYILTSHSNPAFEFIDNTLLIDNQNIEIIHTKKPICEKILNLIFKFIDITDRKLWWQYSAFNLAKEIIESKSIDLIYTHSTPLVDHLVGLKLKKIFPEIKWISHFSDPWTLNPYINYKFSWQKRFNKKLEISILKSCDRVTVTSNKTKELFSNLIDRDKISVLPHTFDEELFNLKSSKNEKLTIVHTGNIYGLRTIEYLIEALKEIDSSNLELLFYGKIKQSEVDLIKEYNLEKSIKIKSQIPYLESLRAISMADFLMVIDAPLENSPFFPSKLADYIGAKKPIIALTSKSSTTAEIVSSLGFSQLIANSSEKDEIKEVLVKIVENRYFKIDSDKLFYYDYENFNLIKEVFFEKF